jgi:hypothetical protein
VAARIGTGGRGSMTDGNELHTAVAHWTKITEDGRTLLCADTDRGKTLIVDVTESSYDGAVLERDYDVGRSVEPETDRQGGDS